jgi:hypothetical protein
MAEDEIGLVLHELATVKFYPRMTASHCAGEDSNHDGCVLPASTAARHTL